jgi:23S rRNA pseudouridine2605 synthase
VLHEGRKRQVRLMLVAVGHPVRRLTRTAIGPVTLGSLKPGQFRMLSPGEVMALMSEAASEPAAASVPPGRPAPPLRGGRASGDPTAGHRPIPRPKKDEVSTSSQPRPTRNPPKPAAERHHDPGRSRPGEPGHEKRG